MALTFLHDIRVVARQGRSVEGAYAGAKCGGGEPRVAGRQVQWDFSWKRVLPVPAPAVWVPPAGTEVAGKCAVLRGEHAGARSAMRAMGAIAIIVVAQHATLSCPEHVLFAVDFEIFVGVPVSMRSAIVVALLLRARTRHGRGRVQREKTLLNACN